MYDRNTCTIYTGHYFRLHEESPPGRRIIYKGSLICDGQLTSDGSQFDGVSDARAGGITAAKSILDWRESRGPAEINLVNGKLYDCDSGAENDCTPIGDGDLREFIAGLKTIIPDIGL
tara:strand:- start:131 stop:484 length:354 start_codon:yes stop_codon:yes gene_type:complete